MKIKELKELIKNLPDDLEVNNPIIEECTEIEQVYYSCTFSVVHANRKDLPIPKKYNIILKFPSFFEYMDIFESAFRKINFLVGENVVIGNTDFKLINDLKVDSNTNVYTKDQVIQMIFKFGTKYNTGELWNASTKIDNIKDQINALIDWK